MRKLMNDDGKMKSKASVKKCIKSKNKTKNIKIINGPISQV